MGSTVRMTEGSVGRHTPADADRDDTVDSVTADETDEHSQQEGIADRSRSWWIGPAAVFLLLVVLILSTVVAAISALSAHESGDAEARDRQILDIASTMAVNLVTLGQDSADSDLSRVIDGTTGEFRDQFVSAADGFGALLTDGGVESVGEVKAAGIVESTEEAATVLAAVTSTVKNNEAPDGEVRVYRMKLTLTNVDGAWLVSNVEFVA